MINVGYTNVEEIGWCSDIITLHSNIQVYILLSKVGRVSVKKVEDDGRILKTVHRSPLSGPDFVFQVTRDVVDKEIQIFTSEKPKYIKYVEM